MNGSPMGSARHGFLVDTYETEILKVLSVWSQFEDADLAFRPHPADPRGRSVLEHMVHQSVSENLWFQNMLEIRVTSNPLPDVETRNAFMEHYAGNARARLDQLRTKPDAWWEGTTSFFEETRSRAWVLTRRIAHTAHHRGQQSALLRMLGRDLHSTYGPTADTGGLLQDRAPVIYAYSGLEELLAEERGARRKAPLPGPGLRPVTERPAAARPESVILGGEDGEWMRRCEDLAAQAAAAGNTPVGALIVANGRVLGEAAEEAPNGDRRFGHAELLAVEAALRVTGRRHLETATLYSTAEPCLLCGYAIRETRLRRVVLGRRSGDTGSLSSRFPVLAATGIDRWGSPPEILRWVASP